MKKHSPDEVERQKQRFEKWQRKNPAKQFKDYFAETVKSKLDEGRRHATLGGNLIGDDFGASGRGIFKRLLDCGLKPDDVCVDYGCGTLRVGSHVIDYLQPRSYWGLEIADFLLEEGRKLIGEAKWQEKQPNLRVISPQSVAEAAAAKPAMLFSSSVLIHVHPDELSEYVGNVMTIIPNGAQAIIDGKWSGGETLQYSGRSWVHDISIVERLVREKGGEMVVLSQEDFELEGFDQKAIRGVFRITHSG